MITPTKPPLLRKILRMLWERAGDAALKPLDQRTTYPPYQDPDRRGLRLAATQLFKAYTSDRAETLFSWRHRHPALNRWWRVTKEVERLRGMHIIEAWNAGKFIEAEIRDLSEGEPEQHQEVVRLLWKFVASMPSDCPPEDPFPYLLYAHAYVKAGNHDEACDNLRKIEAILSVLGPAEIWRIAKTLISALDDDCAHAQAVTRMCWESVAACLAEKPHDLASPTLRHAFAWKEARRWDEVRNALEAEPDHIWPPEWRILHGEACIEAADLAAARVDIGLLCWHHPEDAESAFAVGRFQDIQLNALWQDFCECETELETEDFPSWFLLRAPANAVDPDVAPNSPTGNAYRILKSLLCSPHSIQLRKELKEARPKLFEAFLRTL